MSLSSVFSLSSSASAGSPIFESTGSLPSGRAVPSPLMAFVFPPAGNPSPIGEAEGKLARAISPVSSGISRKRGREEADLKGEKDSIPQVPSGELRKRGRVDDGFIVMGSKEFRRQSADLHDVEQGKGRISYQCRSLVTTGVVTCTAIAAKCFSETGEVVRTALYHYDSVIPHGVDVFIGKLMKDKDTYPKVTKCFLYLAGSFNPVTVTDSRSRILQRLMKKPPAEAGSLDQLLGMIQKHHERNRAIGKTLVIAGTMLNPWNMGPTPRDDRAISRDFT